MKKIIAITFMLITTAVVDVYPNTETLNSEFHYAEIYTENSLLSEDLESSTWNQMFNESSNPCPEGMAPVTVIIEVGGSYLWSKVTFEGSYTRVRCVAIEPIFYED
ncbi:MAG: hypothetical protein LAT84_11135 [Balneolia bacterium]|nr:hypothetical protein [Balneolia bacterium]